jgi:hypothetical protein
MKKTFLLLFSLIFSFSVVMGQQWVPITSDIPQPATIELISSNIETTTINIKVGGYEMKPVITPNGTEHVISLPGAVSLNEEGAPDLYKVAVSSIIPDHAEMELSILHSEFTDFYNVDVAPSKGHILRSVDPSTVPYTYGPVYSADAFFPAEAASLQEPYIFRDFRGQAITINPFHYNPVEKVLRVYHNIIVEISNAGNGQVNVFHRSAPIDEIDSEFNSLYASHFINFEQSRYPVQDEEGSLLIISHGPFMSDMQAFVEWKKTIGRHTEIVDVATIGSSTTVIKDFVLNYYNNNGLTHLLLIGDHQHIPAQNLGGNNGYSDSWYGQLEGSDSFNEVFVGRFSAENTAHVQTQVQKMIEYERDINASDTWLNTGMGIARNEGSGQGHNGGENDYEHMDYIRDSLLNFTYSEVHKAYDGNVPGIPNTNSTLMSEMINDGVSIINFCNHGSQTGWSVGGFSSSHVNNLTNVGKLPFIWSVACDNGKFTSGDCFAEAWMRATHNTTGEPTGAIGTMMSWISQPWTPPQTGQDEMVTILVEKRDHIKRTMGGVSINGSMKMIDLHGSEGIRTHNSWLLFGDPTLQVRTNIPQQMTISHTDAALIGWTEYTVNCNTEDAYVALTIDNEIVGTGYVSGGSATVSLYEPFSEPGTLKIAVTAFNKLTYIEEIDIIPAEGPYLMYSSSTVDDSEGNNNGLSEYNETILLGVEINNMGLDDDNNVVANLSTNSPYVTITDGTQFYGDIPAESSVFIADAFTFVVADDVPDNTQAAFTIQMEGSENIYQSNFNLTLYAPVLHAGSYMVSDHLGNNNGVIDPGETVYLFIETKNMGGGHAYETEGFLDLTNEYVTVNNDQASIGTIESADKRYGVFSISVSPDAPDNTNVDFTFSANAGNYDTQKTFALKIGSIVEDFETGDFAMFNWQFAGDKDWMIDGAEAHEGQFSAKSGNITHSQETEMKLVHNVASPSSISFYRKVSSEAGYDKLEFFIDNTKYGEWSGERSWDKVTYLVTPGERTFRWVYFKDASASSGNDCAWIDYIELPPYSATVAYAGDDGVICGDETFSPNGFANNYSSVQWTTSGNGTFNDPSIENPVYTPSGNDISNGSVILTFAATGSNIMVDDLMLTFAEQAFANAGEDASICENDVFITESAIAENYTSLLWTSSGTGSFDDPSMLQTTYLPGVQDIENSSVVLTLTANNDSGCGEDVDVMILGFAKQAIVFAGESAQTCEVEPVHLDGSAEHFASLMWSTSGSGTFDDPSLADAVYTPGEQDLVAGEITLTLTAEGLGTCDEVSSNMILTVNPKPTAIFSQDVETCAGNAVELSIVLTGTPPWIVNTDFEGEGLLINESPYQWEVSPNETTTYTIFSVSDANMCSDATESNAVVTVKHAPQAPDMPSGPDEVDYAYNTSSVFTIEEVESSLGYEWGIDPDQAGTIVFAGTEATVSWADNFQGEVSIHAKSYNDCGESQISEIKVVDLKNTIGVPALSKQVAMKIYPNPSNGFIMLEIETVSPVKADLNIVNLLGQTVYSEPGLMLSNHVSKSLDLSKLNSGIYFLSLNNLNGVIHKRIIIQ